MLQTDYTLKISEEFRRLVAPLSLAEQKKVEDDICSPEGSRIVRTWNGTILTDYICYEYCELLQLPYETVEISFADRDEAVIWICRDQLKRPGLSLEMRKYLIGKQGKAEIAVAARENDLNAAVGEQNGLKKHYISKYASRYKTGSEYGLSHSTVWKYECYAESLDRMRQTVPDYIEAHLAGRFPISLERAEIMARLNPVKLHEECEQIIAEIQLETPTTWKHRLLPHGTTAHAEAKKRHTIKDMPEYDPDAEIASLALTIPSWISSIDRVMGAADISITTPGARLRLQESLKQLRRTVNAMLRKTKEGERYGL